MIRRPLSLSHLIGVLGVLLLASATWGQDYKIKLERPEKVGNKFAISGSDGMDMETTMYPPGADPKKTQENHKLLLDGVVEVKAVDDAGHVTKLVCTVDTCKMDDKPLYDKGTVITAEQKDGKTQITVNGTVVEGPQSQALGHFLETHDPKDKADDDVIFGTDQRQKVGDSWKINAEAAAESFSKTGLPIKKDDVKGTVKLVSVKPIDGQEVQQLDGEMSVQNVAGAMPDGTAVQSGSMTAAMSKLVPSDESGRPMKEAMAMQMTLHCQATGPDGTAVKFDLVMKGTKDVKITAVKN